MASSPEPATEDATSKPIPSLLTLPPEIRNRIWEQVLFINDSPVNLGTGTPPWIRTSISKPRAQPQPSVLSLLLVCRQINHDAAGLFYDLHTLTLDAKFLSRKPHREGARSFLTTLSPPRLEALRRISVCSIEVSEIGYICSSFQCCPQLEKLHLDTKCFWYRREIGRQSAEIRMALAGLPKLQDFWLQGAIFDGTLDGYRRVCKALREMAKGLRLEAARAKFEVSLGSFEGNHIGVAQTIMCLDDLSLDTIASKRWWTLMKTLCQPTLGICPSLP